MNRQLKTLSVVLMAMAMAAVMASAAQAQFTSAAENATVTGSQVHVLSFGQASGFGSITCETATIHGFLAAKSASTITIKPTYGKCKDPFRVAHVLVNTLEYHLLSSSEKGKATQTGELVMTVTNGVSSHCTMTVKGHQTINGFSYANNADGSVTVTTNTNNITGTLSGGVFACATMVTHSTSGTIKGTTLLKAESGGKQVAVSVH